MSVRVMGWVWEHSRSAPTQRLVLLAIADCANDRGTDAYPSTDTLAAKTGLTARGVRKAVSELESLGELTVDYKAGPRGCNRYRVIMRDPEQDAGYPEQGAASQDTRNVVHGERGSGSTRNHVPGTRNRMTGDPERGSPEPSENHPPTEPSDEPSKSEIESPTERPDVEIICRYLADKIAANGSKRPTIGKTWRTAARLLLDTDGRTVDQVTKAIDWCQADPFWRANILSMPSLRAKYDQLRLAAQRPNGRASPGQQTVNGLQLKDATVDNLDRIQRMATLDQLHQPPPAIGGSP